MRWISREVAYPIGSADAPAPHASTLNHGVGVTVSNHAIVPAAPYVAFVSSVGSIN